MNLGSGDFNLGPKVTYQPMAKTAATPLTRRICFFISKTNPEKIPGPWLWMLLQYGYGVEPSNHPTS